MANWKTDPATDKQRKYILALLDERVVPHEEAARRSVASPTFPKGAASTLITAYKALPKKADKPADSEYVDREEIDRANLAEAVNADGELMADYDMKPGGILNFRQISTLDLSVAYDAYADSEDEAEKARIQIDIDNIKKYRGIA